MKSASRIPMLAALAGGAITTYLLDREEGRRRRARLRDQVQSGWRRAAQARRVTALDVRNRARGTWAALRQRATREEVADEVLVERVRARLGRVVSHPGAVEVSASGGAVTLAGPILERELPRALRAVSRVPGVREVADRLEAHRRDDAVPALQGGRPRVQRPDLLQEHWAPTTRLAAGGAGAAVALYALLRRSPGALVAGVVGAALLARAAANTDMKTLLGGRGHRGIDLRKAIHIRAPASELFAFWGDFENFPKFMRHVREVRRNRGDNWHWTVEGPLGAEVQWDAAVTAVVPEKLIAWSTTPGAYVQHAGMVRFEPEGEGTRVQVEMTYNPPAGAAGHLVASLFGADPGAELDDDLMRLKSFFETGRPARDAARGGSHA